MSAKREVFDEDEMLPLRLEIIPLYHRPIFPGVFAPILIADEKSINAVEKAQSTTGFIGLCLSKKATEDVSSKDLYSYGCVAKIAKKMKTPEGEMNVFVATQKRFKIKRVVKKIDPITAFVTYLEDENEEDLPAFEKLKEILEHVEPRYNV